MFIALEGVDGTGKSTIGKLLADRLEFVYYPTPPKRYCKIREEVDRDYSAEDHYRFYLKAVGEASMEIASFLGKRQGVVADRYWMTTYAYHSAMGISVNHDDFKGIILPNSTIYLEVSEKEQEKRIAFRGRTVGDIRTMSIQNRIRAAYEILLCECNNLIRIDTSSLSTREVVSYAIRHLKVNL